MAFNFPSSPSEGATYTPAGGPTYTFTNGVWRVLPSGVSALSTASIGDDPPANPVNGQIWWDSGGSLDGAGATFIWYEETPGTPATGQWVQQSDTSMPEAPSDGLFYVRSDAGWVKVPKFQQFPLNGLAYGTIPVPANATSARVFGYYWQPTTSPAFLIWQASVAVGTWIATIGNYSTYGFYHYTNAGPTTVVAVTGGAGWAGGLVANSHDNQYFPVQFDGFVTVRRSSAAVLYSAEFRANGITGTGSSGTFHSFLQSYPSLAVTPTGTQMLAFRFTTSTGLVFNPESYINVEWF